MVGPCIEVVGGMGLLPEYDQRQIISNRILKNKNGPFEHQEVEGLRALANLEDVQQEQHVTGTNVELQETQGAIIQPNPLTM